MFSIETWRLLDREQIAQRLAAQLDRELAARKARVGEDALQAAFELAHVGLDVLGEEERDRLVERDRLGFRFLQQDGDAHLELGRLDGDGEAPAEARDQAVLDARRSPWDRCRR